LAIMTVRIEIDGRPATPDQLAAAALATYGHFTAMQVRGGAVRGLDLHLARLDAANRELFGAGLDGGLIREYVRHALGADTADASVRVYVREAGIVGDTPVMVTVRPPGDMPDAAQRLRSVPYQRSIAHVKHAADFGQSYFGRLVARDGFDEALLTGPGGVVSEGSMTNVGFFDNRAFDGRAFDGRAFDGGAVVWPDAPVLAGITMLLLETRLPEHGLRSTRAPVRLAELASFRAAFVTNSRGIAPVCQIDELTIPVDQDLMRTLRAAYASVPWDRVGVER
jgi:branched-subunit amino acid aminotransferase/4-amino-4-deoxychorismate lyase